MNSLTPHRYGYTTATRPSKPYYQALDGLRAFAVLAVFVYHYRPVELPVLGQGWVGVDIFFVLSGFLITGILFDSLGLQKQLRDFYMRRVLRILPLYYAVWIAIFVLSLFTQLDWDKHWLLWPAHLGNFARFLYPNPNSPTHLDVLVVLGPRLSYWLPAILPGHFWSLCVEEQFYLVWPAVVLLVRKRKTLLWICFASIPAALLLRVIAILTLPAWMVDEFVYRCTLTRCDSFLIGGALALWIRGDERHWTHRYADRLCVAIGVAFVAGAAVYYALPASQSVNLSSWGFAVIDLAAAALIYQCLQESSHLGRIFSWTPARRLGQLSYGFYVFHDLPHAFYARLARTLSHGHAVGYTAMPIAFVGTLALTICSYHLIENPFLKLKRFFVHQVHMAPTPQSGFHELSNS